LNQPFSGGGPIVVDKERNPMFPVKDLVDVSDKLGVIQAVKSKLISQPDPAAAKLLAVLSEISKIYLAFEDELTRYLALTLEPAELAEEKSALLELEGGRINARMNSARGHCGRIYNIFTKYLSPWFKRVLRPEEISMMETLFAQMSLTDSMMLEAINNVSEWLTTESQTVLDFVDRNQFREAQQRVSDARRAVLPARRAIASAMRRIYDIEADFIQATGAV
jgi:hypothetical protein